MVFRCFTEKMKGFDVEARGVFAELTENLGIASLTGVRLFNRYDVQGIDADTFELACGSIFSEPQCDICTRETLPELPSPCSILCVEALPGQYDQRADSCAQCIQIMTCGVRPVVKAARVYILLGEISSAEMEKIKGYLINPVECREAAQEKPETLDEQFRAPEMVATLHGLIGADEQGLGEIHKEFGLAMDLADLKFLQSYFRDTEKRDPTLTELRMIDTYWSDHCRHTTFGTHLDDIAITDARVQQAYDLYRDARRELYGELESDRPITLMDIATCGAKILKKRGILKNLDESEEINACSVRIKAKVNGVEEDWLLMFKNETHNHPTEIEPFGGAATCLGGAIRDPLSGRAYVYQAMRVTGAGNPCVPISETMEGKLPQRKITQTAAAGYSSYGNQIGLATGIVHEYYHPGYVAKRMEIGAVVGAAPADNVRRECPKDGDAVILLGGRTGRDGCGGATGSSKTHTLESLTECGSEVQKGNPPEERKIQRLFRDPEVTRMILRCNDFGAGGVSVAIGELADGLMIDLDKVLKKYEGLDGTELAISESQERMAVVVEAKNVEKMIAAADRENLEAVQVARVTESPRLRMSWNGTEIVNLSREFLSSNGAKRSASIAVDAPVCDTKTAEQKGIMARLRAQLSSLNGASQRGLGERFDSTIGASSVLHPFGGKYQLTPEQVMAAKLPVLHGDTETCSVMSFGFAPEYSACDPFGGSEYAVIESVAKLVAAGCDYKDAYLTFQEYFERLYADPKRWGKPFAALLGAFKAQVELGIGAIGGKDSMSGSFMDLDVPPTLVSFAICATDAKKVISSEWKGAGHPVYLFRCAEDYASVRDMWEQFHALCENGKIHSAWACTANGAMEGIFKMAVGNQLGFRLESGIDSELLFSLSRGAIIAECEGEVDGAILLGVTTDDGKFTLDETVELADLIALWEGVFEPVFPTVVKASGEVPVVSYETRLQAPHIGIATPKALIPVFPGTNCEYDTARAVERAGGSADILVIRNLSQAHLTESVNEFVKRAAQSQMIILPGGFSGGDEPDGSGKFIAAFLKNPAARDAVHELLKNRDGLMLGICNGFQALIKLGLVPYGEIRAVDDKSPTLTYNLIGRHQSRFAYTRIASVKSPWMSRCNVGDVYTVPMSHGEGRFVANDEVLKTLLENGQIATQYTDACGVPSMEISANPNGSVWAIEGITSPDGRVLGKMGHSERSGANVAKNVFGNTFQPIFEGGVEYFK